MPDRRPSTRALMHPSLAHRIPAAVAAIVVVAGLLSSPAAADDAADCLRETGDKAIAGCTRQIEGAKLTGRDLAASLAARGTAFRSKNDLDRAIADYDGAIRADATYAEAFRRRGIVWRDKGD